MTIPYFFKLTDNSLAKISIQDQKRVPLCGANPLANL